MRPLVPSPVEFRSWTSKELGVVDILGTGCQKYGISTGLGASDDVPKVFWLEPMTARFSVLKNVLSGRFSASDDF